MLSLRMVRNSGRGFAFCFCCCHLHVFYVFHANRCYLYAFVSFCVFYVNRMVVLMVSADRPPLIAICVCVCFCSSVLLILCAWFSNDFSR